MFSLLKGSEKIPFDTLKVSINEIISRIDRSNFNAFLELCNMARDSNDDFFEFEKLVNTHEVELMKMLKAK